MEPIVRKISRELKSIFDRYRHKKVYAECNFRISDERWGSNVVPNKIWWVFYYEMKNNSTWQINFEYDLPSKAYRVSGEWLESGEKKPKIMTKRKNEACAVVEQRIKEIPRNILQYSFMFDRAEKAGKTLL